MALSFPNQSRSEVFEATSRTIWAPIFSNLSSSSISLHSHTVLGDARRAERLVEHDVAALGAKRDAHRICKNVDAAQPLIDKLGPEYFKLVDGLEQVDPNSSEAKEFMSILSELDKRCSK
jgi:hypothetical protein